MSKDLKRHINEFNGVFKKYVKARIDLLKLSILEKTSGFLSFLFSLLFVVLIAGLVLAFGAAAFAVWYGQTYNNYVDGLLISGGVLLVVAVVFLFIGKKLILSAVVRNLSEILFELEEEENKKT